MTGDLDHATFPVVAYARAALAAAATAHAESLRPANTVSAFTADWSWWERWCTGRDVDPVTVDSALVEAYAYWLWHEANAPLTTARRRLTGLAAGLRARLGGDAVPRHLAAQARKNLTAYARTAAETGQRRRSGQRGKAPAATVDVVRAMVATCDTSLAGLRDKAMILVGFAIAARRSELAGLLAGDITIEAEGLVVAVHTSKLLSSQREVAVPYSARPVTCPVRAWQAWRTAAGLVDADPAFVPIDRHGAMTVRAMSPQAAGEVITRRGRAAGIDTHLTGHSLRSGLATESRRAGHDLTAIARQGGWTPASKDLHGYIQVVDRWEDNAAAGVL